MIFMKGVTEDFLLFIVGVFVILIILVTVFGRGIAYNILGTLADVEPSYLQENLRTALTVAAYSPGDYEAKIKINLKHDISIISSPYTMVYVETTNQFRFSNTTPVAFLSDDCKIVMECTKNCSVMGDPCADHTDCCGILSCTNGQCQSRYKECGDGILQEGEVCDPGNQTVIPPIPAKDSECPGKCTSSCSCPKGYNQCKDGKDNDGDGRCDWNGCGIMPKDTECKNEYDLYEKKFVEEACNNDNECWSTKDNNFQILKCMSKVKFSKIGGVLTIRKYFENNECKIKIEEEK